MGIGGIHIERVLIANRGEIALRICRAAKDMGISTVAVYAESDRDSPFAHYADAAIPLVGNGPLETYLDGKRLVEIAEESGADSVHPGYGFLSESFDFARAVEEAGLIWIGPPSDVILRLGDKISARAIARQVGAPLVPAGDAPIEGVGELEGFVRNYGLPVVIKAAFGGGGRGMRVVRSLDAMAQQLEAAQREAMAAFGRMECFVERYMEEPRHVEAQVLADRYGGVVVVGTRDCTLQRRHQKVVEEAPAPFLTPEQRESIAKAARDICAAAGYVGAGTVEFLVGRDKSVHFLEVNTRLQVEHPVTEETAGIDLVCEQFRIASGEPLRWTGDLYERGHSFEFRINAEDPGNGFLPSPGVVSRFEAPQGPGVRVDSGVEGGSIVDARFDSMLAKLIVTGESRRSALQRARRALAEFKVDGVATLIPLHRAVVEDPEYISEDAEKFLVHTGWIESSLAARNRFDSAGGRLEPAHASVQVGGRLLSVRLPQGIDPAELVRSRRGGKVKSLEDRSSAVVSPMQGTVVSVAVSDGDEVEKGDLVAVIEAMKMENAVFAHRAGLVGELAVDVGGTVRQGTVICRIREEPDEQ